MLGRPGAGKTFASNACSMDPADYVLATFRPEERDAIEAAIAAAAHVIVRFVQSPAGVAGTDVPAPRPVR